MIEQEFKIQIFKTTDQWESGLRHRLDALKEGGITLYALPAFVRWIQESDKIKNLTILAVDACGQVFFSDAETCRIYSYDPEIQRVEQLSCIGGCGSDPGTFQSPARILMDRFTFWIVDVGNNRIQAFSRKNYQIKYIIDQLETLVDMGLDQDANLYILDGKTNQIFKYDKHGLFLKSFEKTHLKAPGGLTVGKENILYVIDTQANGFHRFTQQGDYLGVAGDFSSLPGEFPPSVMTIDRKGNIFVGTTSGLIYQFDSDGSYTGTIPIQRLTDPVQGLAVDSRGNLYASGSKGIAFLSSGQTCTHEKGIYYSKPLDSGIRNCRWHRLALKADLPAKTVLQVWFYASDDSALKETIDDVLSDPEKSIQQKAVIIDKKISWIGPEENPADMLFRGKTGRYLWLKLALSSFDENVRPSVTWMKVYYPRISYIRYLPAIYQDNSVSSAFLERFLSLFESVFYDLETDICQIFKYFDPDTVPSNFLTWLASWLNLALEEEWPEEKKRRLIQEAWKLYKRKGTPSGLSAFIKIYTGKIPLIIEHSIIGKPMVLGADLKLGLNSLLLQTPVRGFRLGDDSILGSTALRGKVQSPEEPFLPMTHRFTVILDLSPEEFAFYEKGVMRILDEEKPAHTAYTLRTVKQMRVDIGAYVEINSRITDYRPMRIGIDAALGAGLIAFDNDETAGKTEQYSRTGRDLTLI